MRPPADVTKQTFNHTPHMHVRFIQQSNASINYYNQFIIIHLVNAEDRQSMWILQQNVGTLKNFIIDMQKIVISVERNNKSNKEVAELGLFNYFFQKEITIFFIY